MLKKFWSWYERHEKLNLGISAGLFTLQLFHLYWLATHVIALRLFDQSFFTPNNFFESLIILVDYLEVPTLISVSLVYINQLRKKFNWKSVLFLIFLNSQWLHIFWITDEFVLEKLTGSGAGTILPLWLAWIAIIIDYLEVPVIYDTLRQFIISLRKHSIKDSLSVLRDRD
jgi:hypothetical protein